MRIVRGGLRRFVSHNGRDAIHLDVKARVEAGLVGGVGGAIGTMVGLGGGAIAVPLLKFFTPLSQQQASATCMPAVLCSAFVGAVSYSLHGSPDCVDLWGAALLGVTASSFTPLGIRLAQRFPSRVLSRGMGVFMLLVVPLVMWDKLTEIWERVWGASLVETTDDDEESEEKRVVGAAFVANGEGPAVASRWRWSGANTSQYQHHVKETLVSTPERIMFTAALGASVGLLSGAFGIGGGVVIVPVLNHLTDAKSAAATSLASILVPSLVGTVTVWRQGTIVRSAMWPVILGASVCSLIGAKIGCYLTDEEQKGCFVALMLSLGTRLMVI